MIIRICHYKKKAWFLLQQFTSARTLFLIQTDGFLFLPANKNVDKCDKVWVISLANKYHSFLGRINGRLPHVFYHFHSPSKQTKQNCLMKEIFLQNGIINNSSCPKNFHLQKQLNSRPR